MKFEQYRRYRERFIQKNIRTPSPMNIVEEFGILPDEARDLMWRYEVRLALQEEVVAE